MVDYKTSSTAVTTSEAASSIQLGYYASAVSDVLGLSINSAEFWYPRVRSESITTRSLDMERLGEVEQMMAEIGRAIAAENWAPRLNNRCDRCAYRMSCPAWAGTSGAYVP